VEEDVLVPLMEGDAHEADMRNCSWSTSKSIRQVLRSQDLGQEPRQQASTDPEVDVGLGHDSMDRTVLQATQPAPVGGLGSVVELGPQSMSPQSGRGDHAS
jgi:hypothetical protein